MRNNIATHGTTTSTRADKFDRIWASVSSADRHVLLGHDDDVLTPADKIRLARLAGELGRQRRTNRYRTLNE